MTRIAIRKVAGIAVPDTPLVEFGTMTEAQSWYNSSDYENISRRYVESAIDVALVDGVSPDFTMSGFAQ